MTLTINLPQRFQMKMYAELLKEFQKSIAIKEKADQLIIGTRPNGAKEEIKVDVTTVETVPSPPPSKPRSAEVNEPAEIVEEKESNVEAIASRAFR